MEKFIENNWATIAVGIFTVIGFALRIYHLDWQCLMPDEQTTYAKISACTNLVDLFLYIAKTDYNPPLYYMFAKLSSFAFGGISVFAIRFPAAIFGVLAIPMAYVVGKEFHNDITGILLSFAIAISFPFVYYSQNARGYTLVMLCFMAFIYFYMKVYKDKSSNRLQIWLAISGIACIWSHFYSVVPIAISAILLLLKHKELLYKFVVCCVVISLSLSMYFQSALNHITKIDEVVVLYSNSEFWIDWMQMISYIPSELIGYYAWIFVIPLALYTVVRYHKNGLVISYWIITICTIIGCVLLTFVTAALPRYSLLVSPLLFMLAFFWISEIISGFDTNHKRIVSVALVMYCISVFSYGSLVSWFTFNVCGYL